jgi:hypothetical protein
MLGTLLFTLQCILASDDIDPGLSSIIYQNLDVTECHVSVATTCVPDFGEQLQNPTHGY